MVFINWTQITCIHFHAEQDCILIEAYIRFIGSLYGDFNPNNSRKRVRKILSLAERGHLLLLLSEVSVCIDKKNPVLYDHFNRGGIVKTFERQFIYLKLN